MKKLIVIEGTDGCGKKTQTEILFNRLTELGTNVKKQAFPAYDSPSCVGVKMFLNGDFGEVGALTSKQTNVLYAFDRLVVMQQYLKHIADGGSIVFDRYVQSSMIHQSAQLNNTQEIDEFVEYVDNFEFEILKLPRPDLVLFLNVPVEVSKKLANAREQLKSGATRDIHEESADHLTQAYNAGLYVAKKFGWKIVDCVKDGQMLSIEEISDKIFEIVTNS